MSTQRARSVVADVASAIGAEGITPNSLRRTFATLARDAGVDDRDIMATGGWSSQHMLDYYDMGRRGSSSSAPGALERFISDSQV